ncbi:MAG: NAD(P)H-dependent oxidoreductase [Alphaproteobacteria bacterium]|nr:NAD(P)H-dependent oxidoreductase [Alphaproteobacteria bacterium]MCB9928745.1 NAD(P)H-dependent oxidoreductase [Alphaproteobacteria bacterium]
MSISVLGLSGSLRPASFNTAALRAAQELAPAGMTIAIADISGVPLYHEDVYQKGFPPAVETLREQIRSADALLIATPEYNYSFSGVLKNAIDWASRPPSHPFDGKPVALMGASPGRLGTARAQYHLRQVLVFLNAHALNKPEVMIASAGSAFDADGKLTDEAARKGIADLLAGLAAAVEKAR